MRFSQVALFPPILDASASAMINPSGDPDVWGYCLKTKTGRGLRRAPRGMCLEADGVRSAQVPFDEQLLEGVFQPGRGVERTVLDRGSSRIDLLLPDLGEVLDGEKVFRVLGQFDSIASLDGA